MNRRQFIRNSVLLTSATAFGADPQEKEDNLTLGFSLYGMKTLKTGEALLRLSSIGYDSVEFCLNDSWDAAPKNLTPKRRRALRTLLDHFELKLTALMVNLSLAGDQKRNHENLKEAAKVGHDLAPDMPPLIETVMGGGKWLEVKNRYRDSLGEWSETAKATKTLICVKPHRSGAVNRPEEAVWLAEQINSPWIKLAYDYSHFAHRGMKLEDTLKTMIPHTRFIHVKDTIIKHGKPRFVLPGESSQIDYRKLIWRAHELGYRGDINVEVSGQVWNQPDYNPISAALKSYRNIAPAFERNK
jgi:inosose dehydratase